MHGIAPDPSTLDTYVTQKMRAAKVAALGRPPLVVAILVLEYRAMIVCFVLAAICTHGRCPPSSLVRSLGVTRDAAEASSDRSGRRACPVLEAI